MRLSTEDQAFVNEITEFIEKNYPDSLRYKQMTRQVFDQSDYKLWHGVLAKQGWGAVHWPKAHGGTDWNEWQHYLFFSTLARHDALQILPFGINMLAPLLMAYGTEEQKALFLPKIINAEHIWCQGYSEPNSGSDLASLRMKATRDGDHYVLNGAKVWTTLAQVADWMFCLVRTSSEGKPQAGISFILVDMKTPGITVTPIITADRSHEVNQVVFDHVRVPASNLVGKENQGWECAKYLLMFERSSFGANLAWLEVIIDKMQHLIAEAMHTHDFPSTDHRHFYLVSLMQAVQEAKTDLLATSFTMKRAVCHPDKMHARKIASLLKVLVSKNIQQVTDLHLKLYQELAMINGANLVFDFFDDAYANTANTLGNCYLNHRKESIYAGSNEIQYNVIAKLLLGL